MLLRGGSWLRGDQKENHRGFLVEVNGKPSPELSHDVTLMSFGGNGLLRRSDDVVKSLCCVETDIKRKIR